MKQQIENAGNYLGIRFEFTLSRGTPRIGSLLVHFLNSQNQFRHLKFALMPEKKSMFPAMLAQVRRVPRGKVASYGDIAYAAGFPGAARQAAWALHGSGSSGVPWHRIVGADGKILLPGEHGFEQRMRLRSEGVQFLGLRVDMKQHRHSFFKKSKPAKPPTAKKNASRKKKSAARKTSSLKTRSQKRRSRNSR
jgi:methylated-DNA-protein-cysteine methyltransferase related protein